MENITEEVDETVAQEGKDTKSDHSREAKSSFFHGCSEESVSYKIFNFFFYGAIQTFNSYVSIYLKTLGLTASHVGLINGTHPLLQVIGAPLAGILGDRYKIKRFLLLTGIIIMTIRTMLYLPFQPQHQTCQIVYVNKTHNRIISTTNIHFHAWKRSLSHVPTRSRKIDKEVQLHDHTFLWPNNDFRVESKIGYRVTDPMSELQEAHYADMEDADVEQTDSTNLVDESTVVGQLNNEVDPFLSPPNVIIGQTKDHKLIYVKKEDQNEIYKIFVILLCLTLFGEIFEALVSTIADTCCLDYLGEKRERFGLFRFWGALGAGLTSPICGAIFDRFSQEICGRTVSGYQFVFYFYFGFMCIAFLGSTHFRYRYHSTSPPGIKKDIKDAIWNLRYGIFLLSSLYMGLCYGFLSSFSFWFLDDLGANATLLGVASSLRSVSENCVYFVSPNVLSRLGHVKVASCCLLAFSVTFLAYSFLENPWVAIPLEVLYTGAYAFSWTTCVSYLNRAAPPGSSTIIQGIVQASFWGLGFGSGSIIGGFSFRVFGGRETFRGFSVSSLVVLLFFIAIQLILMSADRQEKEKTAYKPLSNKDDISNSSEEEKQ